MEIMGGAGGAWTADEHALLYPANLNAGLSRFITDCLAPEDFLEFGSGEGVLASAIAARLELSPSYCIEPLVDKELDTRRNLHLVNVDIFVQPAPRVLDRKFDMVLSIEVAEHVERERHEALFDFLAARAKRWVVFSGARPGQGGHGHVAERPEDEWRLEWTKRGFSFDDRLTVLARNLSDEKNINHRRNVMVFRAPQGFAALDDLEERARPYLADLLNIIARSTKFLDGNLFYVDLLRARGGMPEFSLRTKRANLMGLASVATNILEVGFNAGHSALLCLLASPSSKLTIVDRLDMPYAQLCFDYLASSFPGRLTLIPGDSIDVLPQIRGGAFDLLHLDAGKERTIAADLSVAPGLLSDNHVLIIDDTQNAALNAVVDKLEGAGALAFGAFAEENNAAVKSRWTHKVGRVVDPGRTRRVIERAAETYSDTKFPSIYTTRDSAGAFAGQARAESLVQTMWEIEEAGLDGAFVEVGVAAGHSSVIAAMAASRFKPRDFWLFDTFEGFGEALPDELDHVGESVRTYDLTRYAGQDCKIEVVRRRLLQAGAPELRLFLVKGPAQETVRRFDTGPIAVLRLDADLFEPTLAALEALYPRLQPGGALIVDDYGHWMGCRQAVDQFFSARGETFSASAVDYTCYVARR